MKPAGLIALLLLNARLSAQPAIDTSYQVEITTTACPMINFYRLPKVPGTTDKSSLGYGTSARVLWHPGRLLSVGLLTGYFVIAQDEIPSRPSGWTYDARLAAVPLQIVLTMRSHALEVGVEIGPYLIMSTISGGPGPPTHASRLELGTTIFGSYLLCLSDRIQVGPELRVLHLRYRGIVAVMPSCSLRMIPLKY